MRTVSKSAPRRSVSGLHVAAPCALASLQVSQHSVRRWCAGLAPAGPAKRIREDLSLWYSARKCQAVPAALPLEQRLMSSQSQPTASACSAVAARRAEHGAGHANTAVSRVVPACTDKRVAAQLVQHHEVSTYDNRRPVLDCQTDRLPSSASWSQNQVAALRAELHATERTVEELKRMLREAETAMKQHVHHA